MQLANSSATYTSFYAGTRVKHAIVTRLQQGEGACCQLPGNGTCFTPDTYEEQESCTLPAGITHCGYLWRNEDWSACDAASGSQYRDPQILTP